MRWTPDQSTAFLPEEIRGRFAREAEDLLDALKKQKLYIRLIEGDPKYKDPWRRRRKVSEYNPVQYSIIYWNDYKKIKRKKVEGALRRIRCGEDQPYEERPYEKHAFNRFSYIYDYRLRELIFKVLTEGFLDGDGYGILPDNIVREAFGMPPIEEVDLNFKDVDGPPRPTKKAKRQGIDYNAYFPFRDYRPSSTLEEDLLEEGPDFDNPNSPFYWPTSEDGSNPFKHYPLKEDLE